jgi:hypothetical protein
VGGASERRLEERGSEISNSTVHAPEEQPGRFHVPDVNGRVKEIGGGGYGPPSVGDVNKSVFGNGSNSQPSSPSIPGTNTSANGPQTNTTGTMHQQRGPGLVPGFDTSSNGPSLNLPGATDQHSPGDAQKAVNQRTQQEQQILNQANQGVNVNTPTSVGASVSATDDNPDKSSKKGETSNADTQNNAPPGAVGAAANATASGSAAAASAKGGETSSSGAATGAVGNFIGWLTGRKDPNPEDSGSGAKASDGLAANSPYGQKDRGGGTGNNVEGAGASGGSLSPNSPYARKTQGDGGSDENSSVHHDGTLATGSGIARKGYGDGDGSDNRGDAGGTSGVGSKVVNPSGGQPHELTAGSAAKAN